MGNVDVSCDSMNVPVPLSPSQAWMIQCLQRTMNAIYRGDVVAIGVCSTNISGQPSCFFYDDTGDEALLSAMSTLRGAYHDKQCFAEITAPVTNLSSETH